MARPIFYYETIKKLIVAFGSLFDEIRYKDAFGEEVKVPISYAPRSKFVEFYTAEPDFDRYETRVTLPRMAFELSSITFDSERFVNPLSKITKDVKFSYARIPYNFGFNLYLATKTFEDSLKIVEQIVPYFTPELTVTVKDLDDLDLKTDIPIILNDINFSIEYEGSFEENRVIEWDMNFTMKAYLYSDVRIPQQIKEVIVNLEQKEINRKFEQITNLVEPRSANQNDPHTIIGGINGDPNTWIHP